MASIALPGEPCAGLATGFGAVWVPLCGASGTPARLARVSMADHGVTLFASGPLAEEGGVATSADSVWRVSGAAGELHRVDPASGKVWTTMSKTPLSMTDAASNTLRCQWTGPGGDSLGVGHGAIWLTDYHGGTVSRIELAAAIAACPR